MAEEHGLPEKTYVCEWCDSKHSVFTIDGVEEISLVSNEYTEQCEYCWENVFIGGLTEAQDDSRVCNVCLQYFKKCFNCKEWFLGTATIGERCPQCLKDKKRGANQCKYCDKLITHGTVWSQTINEVTYHICPSCIEKEFFCCEECDKTLPKEYKLNFKHKAVCGTCFRNPATENNKGEK